MFGAKKAEEGEVRILEMREGRAEVYIEADAQRVWDCLSDIYNYEKWAVWFKPQLAPHLDRLEKAGDYFDYEITVLPGLKFSGRSVSVDRQSPQRSEFALVGPYRGGGEFILQPIANGTRLRYTVWGELPSSYLGKVVDKVFLANDLQNKMNDHLQRLKKYVEESS